MNTKKQRLSDNGVQAMEATTRASRSLQEVARKQEVLKRRIAAVEFRIDFLLDVIQDMKEQWNVK